MVETISLPIINGHGGIHFALFWPQEVSGLLITAELPTWEGSYASLLLSLAAVQILTFCVSVLRGTVEDKMKNISIDRRHPPPEG